MSYEKKAFGKGKKWISVSDEQLFKVIEKNFPAHRYGKKAIDVVLDALYEGSVFIFGNSQYREIED